MRFRCSLLARLLPGLDPRLGRLTALPEAVGLVTRLHDVALVRQSIQECGRHLCVTEHGRPFSETPIRRDDHAGAFVELREQMKQQGPAGLAERQISEFVQHHQIDVHQAVGDAAKLEAEVEVSLSAGHDAEVLVFDLPA